MNITIKNKVVLVTGANRGIGKAIVESFIQHGAKKVYLAVRNPESTLGLSQAYGEKVVTLQADVGDTQSINALAAQTKDVQIVVNNAGILEIANPLSAQVEDALNKELNVNVFGLLRMARAFAPILEANENTAFVQLNSVASLKTFAGFTTYCASKAAAYSITQGLKETLAPKGIHVVSVHPGPIKTDMADKAGFEVGDSPACVAEGIIAALEKGEFHVFPDTFAKQIYAAYQSFSDAIITGAATE